MRQMSQDIEIKKIISFLKTTEAKKIKVERN
jgi:hypothetical protein